MYAVVRKGSSLEKAMPSGIRWSASPMRTVWDPVSKYLLRREIERLGPDVVQTYMGRATRLYRPKRGRPVLIARLGGYYRPHPFRHADAWVVNTQGLRSWLVDQGFPKERVFTIGNFVEPLGEGPSARKEAGLGEGDFLVAAFGRFVPVKGLGLLIEAFADLARRRLPRRPVLALVGDGPLRAELEAEARRLGPGVRVVFPGWLEDPAPWLRAADLVVQPSLPEEALGNVVLEAWAAGRPVLVTRFKGALELTRHGVDAFQVEPGDPKALSDAMALLIQDDSLRGSLAAEGARAARERFSKERVVEAYRELYHRLLS